MTNAFDNDDNNNNNNEQLTMTTYPPPPILEVVGEEKKEDEGQEALWVEPVDSPPSTKPHNRRSNNKLVSSSLKKKKKAAQVVLLEESDTTNKRSSSHNNNHEAARKAVLARQMLEKALVLIQDPHERHDMVQTAFQVGLEARMLCEQPQPVPTDLQGLWHDAVTKGVAAYPTSPEATRQCLGVLIDSIQFRDDDISTLGFDNTFELPSTRNNHPPAPPQAPQQEPQQEDLLSLGSLNEILDGPDTPNKVIDTRGDPPPAVVQNKDLLGKHRRLRLLQIFRKTPPRNNNNNNNMDDKDKDIQRFEAAVVVVGVSDEDDEEPEAFQPATAASNHVEQILRDALSNDDTESITSLHGVPLHGTAATQQQQDPPEKSTVVVIKAKPRDPVKPTFVAAPRGAPELLVGKSWEVLEEAGALPVALSSDDDDDDEGDDDVNNKVGTKAMDPLQSAMLLESPASTGITGPGDQQDRYIVEEEHDKFEFELWNPCMDCVGEPMLVTSLRSQSKDSEEEVAAVVDRYTTTTATTITHVELPAALLRESAAVGPSPARPRRSSGQDKAGHKDEMSRMAPSDLTESTGTVSGIRRFPLFARLRRNKAPQATKTIKSDPPKASVPAKASIPAKAKLTPTVIKAEPMVHSANVSSDKSIASTDQIVRITPAKNTKKETSKVALFKPSVSNSNSSNSAMIVSSSSKESSKPSQKSVKSSLFSGLRSVKPSREHGLQAAPSKGMVSSSSQSSASNPVVYQSVPFVHREIIDNSAITVTTLSSETPHLPTVTKTSMDTAPTSASSSLDPSLSSSSTMENDSLLQLIKEQKNRDRRGVDPGDDVVGIVRGVDP